MKKRTKKGIILFITSLFVLMVISYAAVMIYINSSVDKYCNIAVRAHPDCSDKVSALIEYMNCDSHTFEERNLAVWTLGTQGISPAFTAPEQKPFQNTHPPAVFKWIAVIEEGGSGDAGFIPPC